MGATVSGSELDYRISLRILPAGKILQGELRRGSDLSTACEPWQVNLSRTEIEREILSPLREHVARRMEPAELQRIGEALAQMLLPRPALVAIVADLSRCAAPFSSSITLSIATTGSWLASLPWEYCYLSEQALAGLPAEITGFICLKPNIHLVRECLHGYDIGPDQALDTFPIDIVADTLSLLVVWANPSTPAFPALAAAESEAHSVINRILDSPDCRRIKPFELANATRETFREAVQLHRPHIIHFIGHGNATGSQPALVLESATGHVRLMESELREWLNYSEFRLLCLSACETSLLAHNLVAGGNVPCAIAMQLPWRDSIAAQFARAFYSALITPSPVEKALAEGRQAIQGAGADFGNPVLVRSIPGFEPIQLTNLDPPNNLPYLQVGNLVGRDAVIGQIHSTLNTPGNGPLAVIAMGGMGKTHLALEYAHRHKRDYPGGIYWLRAANEAEVSHSFDELGPHFGLPAEIEDRPRRVKERIQDQRAQALLVFDDIGNIAVQNWLPSGARHHILATSRSKEALQGHFHTIDLAELDPEAGAVLMLKSTKSSSASEQEAARRIVMKTGGLPLAIEMSASHAAALGISLESYLVKLEASVVKTLMSARNHFATSALQNDTLFDTMERSYNALNRAGKKVLNIASCYGGPSVSSTLLMQASGLSKEGVNPLFDEALAELSRLLLAKRGWDNRCTVHELIREFVQFRLRAPQRLASTTAAARALSVAIGTANRSMTWHEVKPEILHVPSLLKLCKREKLWAPTFELAIEAGKFRREHASSEEAAQLYDTAMEAAAAGFGNTSLQFARAMLGRALICTLRDEHDKARALGSHAMEIAAAELTWDNPEMADNYNDFGFIIKRAGDSERALGIFEKALSLITEYNGSLYAGILNNRGAAFEELGHYREAIASYTDSIRLGVAHFGEFHPKVAIRLNNTGRVLKKLSMPAEALEMHRRAEVINRETFGEAHPDVAACYWYCGDAEAELAQLGAALVHFRQALEIYVRFYGVQDRRAQATLKSIQRLTN